MHCVAIATLGSATWDAAVPDGSFSHRVVVQRGLLQFTRAWDLLGMRQFSIQVMLETLMLGLGHDERRNAYCV